MNATQTTTGTHSRIDSAKAVECYRAKELAPLLGVSLQQLYIMARKRQIPHKKVGRTVFFPREPITQWLRN